MDHHVKVMLMLWALVIFLLLCGGCVSNPGLIYGAAGSKAFQSYYMGVTFNFDQRPQTTAEPSNLRKTHSLTEHDNVSYQFRDYWAWGLCDSKKEKEKRGRD